MIKFGVRAAAVACAVLLLAPRSATALSDPPRLDPDTAALSAAAAPEPMPVESFVDAAVAFSGASGEGAQKAKEAIMSGLEEAAERFETLADPYKRAEALLGFIHDRYLKRYELYETRVDTAVLSGTFNCVSSAVLYAAFSKRLGLETAGVETKDHAFAVVRVNDRWVDVETTNRYGFDPGSKKEFADAFGRSTGYAYVPPTAYAKRKTIGERELLSLILSNRVTDAEDRKRYDLALPLAVDLYAFLRTPDAYGFLADRLSNLVTALNASKDFETALSLIGNVEERYGKSERTAELRRMTALNALADYGIRRDWDEGVAYADSLRAADMEDPAIYDFVRAATNNPMVDMIRARQWDQADALLMKRAPLLKPEDRALFSRMLTEARLSDLAQRGSFAEAAAAADKARKAGDIDDKRYRELIEYIYGTEANAVARRSGWLAGAEVSKAGLALVPDSGILKQQLATMKSNWAVDIHNRFVVLYNAKKFADARKLIEDSLAVDPTQARLLQDLEIVKRAMK